MAFYVIPFTMAFELMSEHTTFYHDILYNSIEYHPFPYHGLTLSTQKFKGDVP